MPGRAGRAGFGHLAPGDGVVTPGTSQNRDDPATLSRMHSTRNRYTLALSLMLAGCAVPALAAGSPSASAPVDAYAGPAKKYSGTLSRENWKKSQESWNAGGSEYFILDDGAGTPDSRRILRPSKAVPAAVLSRFHGKKVRAVLRPLKDEVWVMSVAEYQSTQHPVVPPEILESMKVYEGGTLVGYRQSRPGGFAVISISAR